MKNESFKLSDGEEVPLVSVHRRGLRNISIRPKTNPKREIYVSSPIWTSMSAIREFLEQKRRWIEKIYAAAPKKVKIRDGDVICVFGKNTTVCARTLGGAPEFLERRLRDKIKAEFLKRVREIVVTAPINLHPKKIAVHDTISRWGSCSSTGTVSFSWRLAFAPPEVMRYVVMHELAHRKHMDHSPKFWAAVGEIYGPGYERAKRWLSQHGAELHKYL